MGQWWESLKKTCKWQKWVLAGCQKCLTTARKKFEWPALKKCWQDTSLIHIFWRSWSLWMRHGSRCSIPKKKAVKTMETFRLATPEKIPSWRVCRENSLFNFLGPEGRYSLIYPLPKGMTITGECYRDILKNQLLSAVAEQWPELVGNFILYHTRLELSQNSWWNRELRHFDILPIHLTLLRAISGCFTPWNSLSEEDNFLRDQVSVQQFTSL